MDRDTRLVLRRLVCQWNEVRAALGLLSPAADVRPDDGWKVFQALSGTAPDVVEVELRPVVFNVPERAYGLSAELFVVVKGLLAVRRERDIKDDTLVTHGFSTKAAYFRRTREGLKHVYGAHFDFALDELGHPVFHAQMRSFQELGASVKEHYGIEGPVLDLVGGVLRTVRLPSAQMDIFSLFLQICADHLLFGQSGPEERAAFNRLLERSRFLKGAGFRSNRLTTEAARMCYRANHWYPILA